MKRFIFSACAVLFGLSGVAFAAGSGGGSAVCTADSWSCGDYGACADTGVRTRVCVMSTDCPGVETPKPQTAEQCEAPKPAAPPTAPQPAAPPSAPWKLKCFNKPSLRARIDCRLALPHEDLAKEITTKYLPEECRALPVKNQAMCVQLYKDFGPCWQLEGIGPRLECARGVIGMSSDEIITLYGECRDLGMASKEKFDCLAAQREKLFTYAKFKFYELSEYAEEYLEDGFIKRKAATDFITQMETKKQQFNKAGNNFARRIAITKEVRAAWIKFMNSVKVNQTDRNILRDAMSDEITQTLNELVDVK